MLEHTYTLRDTENIIYLNRIGLQKPVSCNYLYLVRWNLFLVFSLSLRFCSLHDFHRLAEELKIVTWQYKLLYKSK